MIAGMVGNNACGAHSLVYGSTRDHLLEVKGFLSDGTPIHSKPLLADEFRTTTQLSSREGEIYRYLDGLLSNSENADLLKANTPWPEIRRRNTGYALDLLADMQPWNSDGEPLNLCSLIAGSEGTLMLISAVKLNLMPLPPPHKALLCVHFHSLREAFEGNLVILKHPVSSIEMIDHVILECTAGHRGLKNHRFFIEGEPEAVLIAEIETESPELTLELTNAIVADLKHSGYGYHFPVITGSDINMVWELRKAGLGLLSNVEGEAKPVPVVEDTAVRPADLPQYMHDFGEMLTRLGLSCVYYAHIATGELHLRPVLNMKDPEDIRKFRCIAEETAALVKRYRGSLSGEHGDGRLRGEFIRFMTGDKVYEMFLGLKKVFDPDGLLNPGKITGTPPMDTHLRYSSPYTVPAFDPMFDYSADGGFLQAIERCNGSGDCRRPFEYHGLMCPSYQASLDEQMSTRGRSNLIRETLSQYSDKPFASAALKEILDHCLACKGCKLECPSAVDMARYKAEVMHQYYRYNPMPLGVKMVVNVNAIYRLFEPIPGLYNIFASLPLVAAGVKKTAGIHRKRKLPLLSNPTVNTWIRKNRNHLLEPNTPNGKQILLFIDEFTNFFHADTGIKAIQLLIRLGYRVEPVTGMESGRSAFSKGSLAKAKSLANANVSCLANRVSPDVPLVGLEPSAILTFIDEYPDIVEPNLRKAAAYLAKNTLLIEEFIVAEYEKERIATGQFTVEPAQILVHGHCHQKALASSDALKRMLSIPKNYSVSEIPSGCCGMAGSFGMETKNFELSMRIGEQTLFPAVRNMVDGTILAMPGTSCRQQILDSTGIMAHHPVEILFDALKGEKS
jgi:Fe-S oxidoreductase/FAD/FMN-containing dehydrogenase